MAADGNTRVLEFKTACSRIAQKLFLKHQTSDGSVIEGPQATGSFWLQDGSWFLITNWHVVTGYHPDSTHSISKDGFWPTHVNFSYIIAESDTSNVGHLRLSWSGRVAPLYDEENRPLWWEHPTHGRSVDVVALKLFDDGLECANIYSLPINKHPKWFNLRLVPGDDCFVLGYPKGIDGGFHLPLWKRASLASEPSIDHANLPRLLVDTATRNGMSGAPVVAVSNGYNVPEGIENRAAEPFGIKDAVFGRVESFVGIYSGRTDDDPLGIQIGIVWKAKVIDEILQGKVIGHNPLAHFS